ncbi:DUF72 domain-containing protein [Longitalea arenae]|uniref:DUF72 domain-containing protein n=1 Tax=Longitalea arenae TaxID=2812558 RepID=UPI0019671AC9|nr:DUF72 domain-containing protein [Longitalea arenae]
MKFGKLPESELNTVDFNLPPEPAGNRKILGGVKKDAVKVHIGCPLWGVPGWIGKIYPAKAREKDFLANYVQHFNGIELNATHYKIYDEVAIAKWAEKADDRNFIFCPKLFQGITHQGGLRGKETMIMEFLQGVKAFKEHLGPVFIQLSDSFGPARKEELFTFLRSLPQEVSFFLELRHPDWFSRETIRKELFNTLYLLKTGAVITDTAGRRDCVHMHLTIPKAFVRFVANSLHPSDYTRLDAWIERIISWIEQGLQELYFFVHMDDELYSPELITYLTDKLNAACSLQLPQPRFIEAEGQRAGSQITFFD